MNLKNRFSSYRFKTTLYVTTFITIVLILLWSSTQVMFKIFFESYQLDKIGSIIEAIPENGNNLDYLLDSLAYENEVCIVRTGEFVSSTYNLKMSGCPFNNASDDLSEMMEDFSTSNKESHQYRFVNDDNETESVIYSIKNNESSIFIYANLEDTSVITNLLRDQLLYLTLIAIIISVLLSYFLSTKIVEPITKITNKAKFLGTGKEINFEKNGIKEVDELVDALNLAKSEIGKTEELKRDLLANVSHDLKTPLTMIKAYTEMIRDISYTDKEKQKEHLNIIISETDRLTLLVNDILDISKLQSKNNTLNAEKYDLAVEINSLVKNYQIIKETEDYNFIVEMPKTVMIKADKSKINQVIYNLVNNAINYTGDDKKVYITVKKRNSGGFYFEVKDTGKGIKEKDINNIWEKYYKTDKKHKRNVVSSGIGLSIVKEIFLLHKYEYGVKTSDKGTIFYFIIK